MEALLVVVVVVAVAIFVSVPLRRSHAPAPAAELDFESELAALEAAKEAKYREIRDAELDFRTGKLSEADHAALDRDLRAEAVALLKQIDGVRARREASVSEAEGVR